MSKQIVLPPKTIFFYFKYVIKISASALQNFQVAPLILLWKGSVSVYFQDDTDILGQYNISFDPESRKLYFFAGSDNGCWAEG